MGFLRKDSTAPGCENGRSRGGLQGRLGGLFGRFASVDRAEEVGGPSFASDAPGDDASATTVLPVVDADSLAAGVGADLSVGSTPARPGSDATGELPLVGCDDSPAGDAGVTGELPAVGAETTGELPPVADIGSSAVGAETTGALPVADAGTTAEFLRVASTQGTNPAVTDVLPAIHTDEASAETAGEPPSTGADATDGLPVAGVGSTAELPLAGIGAHADHPGGDAGDLGSGEVADEAPVPGVLTFGPDGSDTGGKDVPDDAFGAGDSDRPVPGGHRGRPHVADVLMFRPTHPADASRPAAHPADVEHAAARHAGAGTTEEGPHTSDVTQGLPGFSMTQAAHKGGAGDGNGGSRFHAALSGHVARTALRIVGLSLGAVVLVGGGFALGTRFGTQVMDAVFPSVSAGRPQEESVATELTDGYDGALARRIAAAAADVAAGALTSPSLDEVTAGAIGGVLTSAGDVDAAYLTQEEYERYQRLAGTSNVGVGASFVDGARGPVVALVAQGSPAEEAGLRPGDIITAVGGERDGATSAAVLADALSLASDAGVELAWVSPDAGTAAAGAATSNATAADAGSSVEGVGAPETTATLHPSDGTPAPLVSARLEEGTGVVTLLRFAPGVADELSAALSDLLERGATTFVLDLRDNPGGDVSEAARVASLFMGGGTVAVATTREGEERLEVTPGMSVTDAPLAVLVSRSTASAAEIVAGGLQDHQRALIVGELTHGKGSSQTVRTLSFGGAISYTTATYATPDGYEIQGQGIAPDLLVVSSLPLERRLAADAQGDAQLTAAIDAVRSWGQGGTIAVDGLSNAPGPQDDAFDQAREVLRSAAHTPVPAGAGDAPAAGAGDAPSADARAVVGSPAPDDAAGDDPSAAELAAVEPAAGDGAGDLAVAADGGDAPAGVPASDASTSDPDAASAGASS